MGNTGWDTYSPENDSDVARWHRARQERQERKSGAAVELDRGRSATRSWRSACIRSTGAPPP